MKPKQDEYWVVERLPRVLQPKHRLVALRGERFGRACWFVPGDEDYCPDEWFKPIRKVRLS